MVLWRAEGSADEQYAAVREGQDKCRQTETDRPHQPPSLVCQHPRRGSCPPFPPASSLYSAQTASTHLILQPPARRTARPAAPTAAGHLPAPRAPLTALPRRLPLRCAARRPGRCRCCCQPGGSSAAKRSRARLALRQLQRRRGGCCKPARGCRWRRRRAATPSAPGQAPPPARC